MTNVGLSAAALLDGGWNLNDSKGLIREYGLTEEEADEILTEMFAIINDL